MLYITGFAMYNLERESLLLGRIHTEKDEGPDNFARIFFFLCEKLLVKVHRIN